MCFCYKKQKKANEILSGLEGTEIRIRDRQRLNQKNQTTLIKTQTNQKNQTTLIKTQTNQKNQTTLIKTQTNQKNQTTLIKIKNNLKLLINF